MSTDTLSERVTDLRLWVETEHTRYMPAHAADTLREVERLLALVDPSWALDAHVACELALLHATPNALEQAEIARERLDESRDRFLT